LLCAPGPLRNVPGIKAPTLCLLPLRMTHEIVEAVGLTDAGNVRQFNEDRIVVAPEIGVVAVADGMGGHRAGEIASHLAADLVVNGLRRQFADGATATQHSPLLAVDKSINQANRTIYDAAQANPSRLGMGTTLAVALFHADGVTIAHVGDSRIYRLRGGKLALLTRDDSLLRQQVESGLIGASDVADSHNRSLVTQALGVAEHVDPHLRDVDAIPGDLFLLCTDGLNDLVDDADIELIVHSLSGNLALASQILVQTAKDNGGYDNVSVILARTRGSPRHVHRNGFLPRIAGWLRRNRRQR
jgi:serine/threonine protein phosphatase PrpC